MEVRVSLFAGATADRSADTMATMTMMSHGIPNCIGICTMATTTTGVDM